MKLCAHGVMVVTGHSTNERSVLPIPYSDCLVIRARQDPGQFMVEEDCSDIVQVAIEREDTAASLVRPDLDLVIITARYEEWLCFVEINASDRAIMLFKSVDQRAHAVVP